MECILGFIIFTIIAGWLLKGGPKRVSDGIRQSGSGRVSCPMCAEQILPQAKICPFCKSTIQRKQ
jgi:hypothetical protein